MGWKQDHAGVGVEDQWGHELGQTGAGKSAPLGYQSWKCEHGVQSQAPLEVNTGCEIQVDCEFGESAADSVPPGLVVPEEPDACVGTGADGRGCISKPHSPPPVLLLLHQTCHYQRKDSPVEALILSPEPLGGDEEERTGKEAGKGKQGGNK